MLNPRLTDKLIDHQERTNIERTAVWSGRTIAAMQVWDILRATQWLRHKLEAQDRPVVVFAKGEMAVPSLYATLLNPDIQKLIVRDLPASHNNAPPLLNVLRFTDIPEIAALVSPRLRFLGARSPHIKSAEHVESLPRALFPKAALPE